MIIIIQDGMSLIDLTRSWADEAEGVQDLNDLDIGEMVAIAGVLHSKSSGIVLMRRTRNGWEQRGRFTTAHLNCDYVNNERLDCILENWIPVDWNQAEAMRITPGQEKTMWQPFLDGEPLKGLSHIN